MGLLTNLKAQKAMTLQGKGETEKARKLYEECEAEGLMSARPLLGYAVLLIRAEEYEKVQHLLTKIQKCPDINPAQKSQVYVYYAICCIKRGESRKGVLLLEKQHGRTPTGLTYQTLGSMYVEKYAGKPWPPRAAQYDDYGGEVAPAQTEEQAAQEWVEDMDKAEKFLRDALEYDDEDPICLDNMGQWLYRIKGDKAAAKEWFQKAIEIRPTQIDTLWFLSRYDVEEGKDEEAIDKLETSLSSHFSPLNYCTRQMVEEEIARLKKE